jgi:hypothetical protein
MKMSQYTEAAQDMVEEISDDRARQGLGLVSIAIGLTELTMPKQLDRFLGTGDGENAGVFRTRGGGCARGVGAGGGGGEIAAAGGGDGSVRDGAAGRAGGRVVREAADDGAEGVVPLAKRSHVAMRPVFR